MKKLLLHSSVFAFAVLLLLASQVTARQIDTPRPSPHNVFTQQVGLTDITVDYSRPGAKGREIFGGLVAYGQIWRTGANNATTIEFSTDVTLEGNKVAAGKYALYSVPGQNEWSIHLYTDLSLGGNVGGYDKSKELLQFTVKPSKVTEAVETFTIDINDLKDDQASINLIWENTKVSFTVGVEYDGIVMKQIERAMRNPLGQVATQYATAATYFLDNEKDMKQAQEWIDKAIEINPNAFWYMHTKARIHAAQKDYKGAIEVAKQSMEKAKANPGGDFGYVKRNEDAIAMWKKKK